MGCKYLSTFARALQGVIAAETKPPVGVDMANARVAVSEQYL
jgi:hypothetical protein